MEDPNIKYQKTFLIIRIIFGWVQWDGQHFGYYLLTFAWILNIASYCYTIGYYETDQFRICMIMAILCGAVQVGLPLHGQISINTPQYSMHSNSR